MRFGYDFSVKPPQWGNQLPQNFLTGSVKILHVSHYGPGWALIGSYNPARLFFWLNFTDM